MDLRSHLWEYAGFPLALATGAVNFLLGASFPKALGAAVLVLIVWLATRRLWPAAKPDLDPGSAPNPTTDGDLAKLSMREREVAALVGVGLSNKEIARRLVPPVQEGTVETTLTHIYTKLNIENRSQLAVWALRHEIGPPPTAPKKVGSS
jgi:DNA-binding NarL/FixJ family response regulator